MIVASRVFPAKGSQAGPRSSYKDGWSPTAIALKYQRIAILNILGHVQGTKGRSVWKNLHEQSIGIIKIVDGWVETVLKLNWIPPETGWKVMDSTIFGSAYWKTLDTMVTATFCIGQLEGLKLKLHGKQRQLLRENINEAVKLREKMVQDGKLKKYHQAVLREQLTPNPLTSITLPTGQLLENPLEIHLALTDHYEKVFATPSQHEHGIHSEDWNWETGGTKADFIERIKHHLIPSEYQDILWTAMQASNGGIGGCF